MKVFSCFLLVVVAAATEVTPDACQGESNIPCEGRARIQYPSVRRNESVRETLFGVEISDPYRWLEDQESNETKQFVDAQNEVTDAYLHGAKDADKFRERMRSMWNYPKYKIPTRSGNRYFFQMNSGLENQDILYKMESLDATPEVLLDPNLLSSSGSLSIGILIFSVDEKIMGYSVQDVSTEWYEFRFKNVETGEDLPDVLEKLKFTSITWTNDSKGVFYMRYADLENESPRISKIYYHLLGTNQSEDVVFVELPEGSTDVLYPVVSDCGQWLVILGYATTSYNTLYFVDLTTLTNGIRGPVSYEKVVSTYEADYWYISNIGSKFIFQTNKDASNYQVIEIDFNNYARENWNTLIAQHETDVMDSVTMAAQDKLVINYSSHVKSVLRVYSATDGSLVHEYYPPVMGTISSISGNIKYSDIFYTFTSFIVPGNIYRLDLGTLPELQHTIFRSSTVEGLDPNEYRVSQVFYHSKDQTRVPMYIISKKTIVLDGSNPCYLHGYGGFNYKLLPEYSTFGLVYMKHLNGIMVVANIRGGGEYGSEWHKGGILLNKQNSFDDFQEAAKYLIDNRYTNSTMLTIQGDSNGGLLAAACLTQRPDLFGAAIVGIGVLDMLRYHKFTIGYLWISDYGSPDNETHFKNLLTYSPLHNIRIPTTGQYPPTLVTTADHDVRVPPAFSYKFAAALQYTLGNLNTQANPLLLKVYKNIGHGIGISTEFLITDAVNKLCFLQRALKLKYVD